MRALSIDDVKANPNSVLTQPLPEHPSRYLLLLAEAATTFLRETANITMEENYDVDNRPSPIYLSANETFWAANRKCTEITTILHKNFPEPDQAEFFEFENCSFCGKILKFFDRLPS